MSLLQWKTMRMLPWTTLKNLWLEMWSMSEWVVSLCISLLLRIIHMMCITLLIVMISSDFYKSPSSRNPPDEQGVREEWEKHIGWHHKEDIRRLRKSNNHAQQRYVKPKNIHNNNDDIPSMRWWFSSILLFILIIGIIFSRIFRHNKCRKGSKRRKTIESIV